ncbi:MAG: rhodanese-like domain-containing protein [Bacteroidales bacterium]
MKRVIYVSVLMVLVLTALTSCSGKKSGGQEAAVTAQATIPEPVVDNETNLLLKGLVSSGDYVNSQEYPSLIKASLVNSADMSKNLVIDIRPSDQFKAGHIKGAVNKRFEDLPAYFESGIKPFEYDKIILVCEDGQTSSYATCLLRLRGYGNVYAMRWGMSGWNKRFADESWLKNLSGKFESQLDTVTHQKPLPGTMPVLKTGFSSEKEIADSRFREVFSAGTGSVLVTADEVFSNPSSFYVINLERKDKYNDGHVPGAVRYKPDGTLGILKEMATIPTGKTVVVYCGTGHNSAFATAYLRLFGYDARTLRYGNNSFMHDRMIKQKAALSWLPFSIADVNDFSVVK